MVAMKIRQRQASNGHPTISRRLLSLFSLLIGLVVMSVLYNINVFVEEVNEVAVAPTSSFELSSPTPRSPSESSSRLRKDHPVCFSDHLFANTATAKSLNIFKVGKFSKIGRNVTSSIRYNYTCPSMKPRYNCAKNETESSLQYGEHATHWKLILVPRQRQEACNLWELMSSLGGPIGLANNLLSHKPKSHSMINVFIGGNSLLRQMFEALICGFHEDITNQLVQRGSKYGISVTDSKNRGGRKVELADTGSLEPPPDASSGVCDYTDSKKYYRNGLQLPVVCKYNSSDRGEHVTAGSEGYDDNLGMIEFGGLIRFHYIFNPRVHENVTAIFHSKFHLDPSEIDILVFNDGADKVFEERYPQVVDIFEKKGIWRSKIIWPMWKMFRKMQERDIERWFGADNPWIRNPPDVHPCMPGMPDDEVNLLMFLMLSGSVLHFIPRYVK